MRKALVTFTLAAMIALAVPFGFTAVARASTGHAVSGHVAARSCDDHWKAQWGRKNLNTIDYIWGEWTVNSCQQKLEVSGVCHNFIANTTYHVFSGRVKAVNLKAEADCSLDDVMIAGFIRFTRADGTWYPWKTLCTSCRGPVGSPHAEAHRRTG